MLRENERWIYHYELQLRPNPPITPYVELDELLPWIRETLERGEAFQDIEKGDAIVRLLEMYEDLGNDTVVLLLYISDEKGSDPVFGQRTGQQRVERQQTGEGMVYSAHLVVSRTPSYPGSHGYLTLPENVPGLSRTRVQRFLNHLFRLASKDKLFFRDENQKTRPYRPIVRFDGHQSEELTEGLADGEFQGDELIVVQPVSGGLDENAYVRERVYKAAACGAARRPPGGSRLK